MAPLDGAARTRRDAANQRLTCYLLARENANQEEAAQFLPKYFTAPVTPEVARRYVKVTQDWMHYPATKTKGLGDIDINALEPVVAILRKANLIKNPIDLKQYFTNVFQEKYGR